MTIRRGVEWGMVVPRPEQLVVLDSDAAMAHAVAAHPDPACRPAWATSDGDLHRTLGAPGDRETMQRLPIDAIVAVLDGEEHLAVAHVVARRSWWRGPIVAVMNVGHLGRWNVAPRAHPNDGRLDVVEVASSMPLRARWQARARLPYGTHVPHPSIHTRQVTVARWEFEHPLRVWVDGIEHGDVRCLEVAVRPDACEVHV